MTLFLPALTAKDKLGLKLENFQILIHQMKPKGVHHLKSLAEYILMVEHCILTLLLIWSVCVRACMRACVHVCVCVRGQAQD